MRFIFFSLRDFKNDVGETVRIYGILNSLASSGEQVIFISNAVKHDSFHPSIQHVFINSRLREKPIFQSLLALFPAVVSYYAFWKTFRKIKMALLSVKVEQEPVFFFDYLDNSVGYVLSKRQLISSYVNDVHGIATLEFRSHIDNSKSFWGKSLNRLKHYLVDRLDKKVFEDAAGLIYGSENMENYYIDNYDLKFKKSCVIPYLLSPEAINRQVDPVLQSKLQSQLGITQQTFVILFIGTYKPTAGVDDLIAAFDQLFKQYDNCKLVLVGKGPSKEHCLKMAATLESNKSIVFIDRIPYSDLYTYQSLARVIVCPDKDNTYSHYVIHVKYFDALLSGKLVINGAFESVKEINKADFLSLTFRPSDREDLYRRLLLCREKVDFLEKQYSHVRDFTAQHFTYHSYISKLKSSFSM